jgi:WXG100 family type VII secretion target
LRIKAEELQQLNEKFRSEINSLIDDESALRGQYQGASSDAFHNSFSQNVSQMENFYNEIAQYILKLLQIAENYEKAEQENIAIVGK